MAVERDAARYVFEAAAKGVEADFASGDPAEDDPARGAQWGPERTVSAEMVRALCVGSPKHPVEARGIQIRGARIAGKLDLHSATVTSPLALRECYLEQAPVLTMASVRALEFTGSYIRGLRAEELRAGGSVFLDQGFTATGEVSLAGADIGGQLNCGGGSFRKEDGFALNADSLTAKGSVFLDHGFTATGEVRLAGADIGGQLNCSGGSFRNKGGLALNADSITAKGDVFISEGFTATGEVRLAGADIGGQLNCSGGSFRNKGGLALNADRISAKGSVGLHQGFTATGEVLLAGADIGGHLVCAGGSFQNKDGDALNAYSLTAKGGVFLHEGFTATGEVCLAGAAIGGQLNCSGGSFQNKDGYALNAYSLTAKLDVFLNEGFTATGEVLLTRADIGGQLNCSGGSFRKEGGDAFAGETMKVAQAFFWEEVSLAPGSQLNLFYAEVGTLVDDRSSWPEEGDLFLDGFVYAALAPSAPREVADRLEWLNRQRPGYFPQPYEQLIKVYRAEGHDRFAKKVAIAKEDARTTKGNLSRPARWWGRFLKLTVNYGYEPGRAIWGIWVLVVVGAVLFATNPAVVVPTRPGLGIDGASACTADYPCFYPLVYSADVVLPIIDLRQQDFWIPDASNPWGWAYLTYLWLSILAGWALATALVAGLTGVVRRE